MKTLRPNIFVILVLVNLFVLMPSCNIGQTEEQTILFDQYYTINPASLIDSLKNGDTDVFTPVNDELAFIPIDQSVVVDWLQPDYFYIANTLYDGVLGRTLQDWELMGMDFQLGCTDVQNGFQNGRLEFFKVIKEKEQESRLTRFIDIDPRRNFVHVKEWEFYPNLINLEAIDLAQLKISADLALQIAENNGGQERRESVGNACNIFLGLFPNSASYRGWEVIYTRSEDRAAFFHVQIDPVTGEIHFP